MRYNHKDKVTYAGAVPLNILGNIASWESKMADAKGFRDKWRLLFSFLVFALALSQFTRATQQREHKSKNKKKERSPFLSLNCACTCACVTPIYTFTYFTYACAYACAFIIHVNQPQAFPNSNTIKCHKYSPPGPQYLQLY